MLNKVERNGLRYSDKSLQQNAGKVRRWLNVKYCKFISLYAEFTEAKAIKRQLFSWIGQGKRLDLRFFWRKAGLWRSIAVISFDRL